MQKVEGSSPFSRSFWKPCYWLGFLFLYSRVGSSREGAGTTFGYQSGEQHVHEGRYPS